MIEKIAYYLGRRDEQPNIQLAIELAASGDKKAIDEIATGLSDKNSGIAGDCIKVMYEIAERKPELVAASSPERAKIVFPLILNILKHAGPRKYRSIRKGLLYV